MRERAAAIAALLLAGAGSAARGDARLAGSWIEVTGPGNTLASLAEAIGDPEVLSFTPDGVAVSRRNLRIRGELRIGGEENWDGYLRYAQILRFDAARCGQVRIEVAPEGRLVLERAKLAVIHDPKARDDCADGNRLDVAGTLEAADSVVAGNFNGRFAAGARVRLERATISFAQVSGLIADGVGDLDAVDSRFVDSALYGASLAPPPGGLRFRGCVFRGLAADVYHRGGGPVDLLDCDVKTIRFARRQGVVRVRWTVRVAAGRPGLRIVARSEAGCGAPEVVEGETGRDGSCALLLTEFAATPDEMERRDGTNNATPHAISVYDGDREIVRIRNYSVFTKGQTFTVPERPR